MNDNVKALADRLAEKRKGGLVDIKFYVHGVPASSPKKVLTEAAFMLAAIEDGACEPFSFKDSRAIRVP